MIVRGDELAFRELPGHPGRASADPLGALRAAGVSVEGVSARVVWVEPATARQSHRHPHSPEVIYVVQGDGIAWQDGQRDAVSPGDVIFVPTGVPHATLATSGRLLLVCFFPHPDLAGNTEELELRATASG